jgi:hypothetical protein
MNIISKLIIFIPKILLPTHAAYIDSICMKVIQNIPFTKAVISVYTKISDILGSLKLV